jgi:hypothetical protein
MSGIRSYDLSGDSVNSMIRALEGNEKERVMWHDLLTDWVESRNRKMKISKWIEEWIVKYAPTPAHHPKDQKFNDEDLQDWVYYQMEYMSGIDWDKEEQKITLNKYSSRPLLNDERTQELLDYLNSKVGEL